MGMRVHEGGLTLGKSRIEESCDGGGGSQTLTLVLTVAIA